MTFCFGLDQLPVYSWQPKQLSTSPMACQTQGWHFCPDAFLILTLLERVPLTQQRRQQLHHIKTHLEGEDQFLQSHMQGAELPDGSCSGERSSLTPQTPKFSLSFPTPSRCYIGNFSIPNLKCLNTQPRGQSLSWPFLQPKEYEMSL